MLKHYLFVGLLGFSALAEVKVYVVGEHLELKGDLIIAREYNSNCYYVGEYSKKRSAIEFKVKSCLYDSHAKTDKVKLSVSASYPIKHEQPLMLISD